SRAGAKVISKAEFIDFINNNEIKINFNGEEKIIKSKVIVAADGVESLVLRKAGLRSNKKPKFVDSGYQYEMSNVKLEDPHKIVLYFSFAAAPRGYVWMFPKGKDRANVGIGIAGDHKEKTAKEYLDEFISKHTELSQGSILEVNAGNIPVGDMMKDMVINNVIGVGDSVNQVNPIHGGGIAESIRAGQLLGNIIKDAISKNDIKLLKKYNEAWWSQNGEKLEKVERVREIFEKLTDNDLNYLAENLTSDDLVAFASGERVAKLSKLTLGLSVKRLKRKVGL
ncbi:MAG: NAD(P)/FAD-dependent oxidoreductase, partial [Candidatus Aenigmatarchaeota archaeon]